MYDLPYILTLATLTSFQLNDLIGFIVALVAVQVSERKTSPQDLSFGWARAQLLGAFFNGAFLLALGLSISLQSIERFISIERVGNPKLVLIIGCVGLTLNIISALFLHEHDHDHGHGPTGDVENSAPTSSHEAHMHMIGTPKKHGMDLGILGVLIHVIGDAINNIGVIISAVIIWFVKSPNRFYADPAVSMWIAIMILISAIPLTKRSGKILLQSAPLGVKIDDIKHDLESIPGVQSVHELHVWRLDQKKAIATAHIVVSDPDIESFMRNAKTFRECLHAYGIHSATLQPELATAPGQTLEPVEITSSITSAASTARPSIEKCGLACSVVCEELKCCN
jgi:zinc transporter 1